MTRLLARDRADAASIVAWIPEDLEETAVAPKGG